ncbi:MAG TPA: hypothetical protein VGR67_09795 [Candidatus Polarisedimenticolia bacterium]|nr:hypothetical protein [Candidatus Polarisedimenticolia bacterium]
MRRILLDRAGPRTICQVLLVLVMSMMMISTVTAAPGGSKSGRVQRTGNERCWVTPDPVNDGQQYTVFGSGFTTGQAVSIFVGDGSILMGVSDNLGVFSAWDWASFRSPASITVNVYPSGDRKMTLLATCSFQANGSAQ